MHLMNRRMPNGTSGGVGGGAGWPAPPTRSNLARISMDLGCYARPPRPERPERTPDSHESAPNSLPLC
jgi:hypothetical protein